MALFDDAAVDVVALIEDITKTYYDAVMEGRKDPTLMLVRVLSLRSGRWL